MADVCFIEVAGGGVVRCGILIIPSPFSTGVLPVNSGARAVSLVALGVLAAPPGAARTPRATKDTARAPLFTGNTPVENGEGIMSIPHRTTPPPATSIKQTSAIRQRAERRRGDHEALIMKYTFLG